MLPSSATVLPRGPDWSYELKWDGYRIVAEKARRRVVLRTRNGNDVTAHYPTIAAAIRRLPLTSVTLDGEIVALDAGGRPSFQVLPHGVSKRLTAAYHVFDVLEMNGNRLVHRPLDDRRRQLRSIPWATPLLLSEPLPGTAAQIAKAIQRLNLEGVVAKRRRSVYRPGKRSDDWVKVRLSHRQEFVVGGYRPNGGTFDGLIVGYRDKLRLLFAGTVRAGFTPAVRRGLLELLRPLVVNRCPFANLPVIKHGRSDEGITEEAMTEMQWVKPRIVVEITFVEWTQTSVLRHPAFVAVRVSHRHILD